MLFYMQMKNWFLIFLMLTIAYLIHQKSNSSYKIVARAGIFQNSLIR